MIIKVHPHELELINYETTNEKESHVSDFTFEFDEEITDDFVKMAYFTKDGITYEKLIEDNHVDYAPEVLTSIGYVKIGVSCYKVDGEKVIRYNPTPLVKYIEEGSLQDAENSEEITPSDKEQMEQAIQDIETKVNNIDIEANKVDKKTTIIITKKDGTQETTEINDGVDGQDGADFEYNWSGTSLGVKTSEEQNYKYVNLKGERGEPGAIKMIIVNELPQTGQEDTIYLVPLATPESQENRYAEYVYVNNNWELLGKIGIQVDLTDYYTKQETNNLLNNKQDKITQTNKLDYSLIDNTPTIPSKTSDLTNDSDYQNATQVQTAINNVVGDINTALDTINGEVI